MSSGPLDAKPSSAVLINDAKVEALAGLLREQFRGAPPAAAAWDNPMFWNVEASREDRCQFLVVGNAINFRFWSLVDGRVIPSAGRVDGVEFEGSMYLWRRLRTAVSRGEFALDSRSLASLTPDQYVCAFADDQGQCPLEPGLEDRVANLRDLGSNLAKHWGGQFVNLLDTAEGSLQSFALLSAGLRAFDDPIRKLTMVNAIMLEGSGLASFDEDPLPGIDYHLVKQAVRQGLVTPSGSIQRKLATSRLLEAEESLALRKATLEALLQVAARASLSTAVLDNLYWLNRRVCSEEKPACQRAEGGRCPFESVCAQRTEFGRPLEMTRYY